MKTIQIGNGKVKAIQFETLQEIQKIYSDAFIVDYFNMTFFKVASMQVDYLKRRREVKK